jgi:anthranilate synthase/aminodeoxychorismate synthase-like glutamine amidotransferase
MILMIDNYDSFTFNLVQYFKELGEQVSVFRNDGITLDQITELNPDRIVISPGPGNPDNAGISLQLVEAFKGRVPILGVCLGHQVIAQHFGAEIIKSEIILHGKTSKLLHNNQGIFKNIENNYDVTRYHSLVVDESTLPDSLCIDAWSMENNRRVIMGISDRHLGLYGIQFHPEAILTEHGHLLLNNFLTIS